MTLSDIPFDGPVGAVRIAEVAGELVVNPTYEQRAAASLEVVVAGTATGITMVEGGADEASEERMVEAVTLAHERIKELCTLQLQLVTAAGPRQQAATAAGGGSARRPRRAVAVGVAADAGGLLRQG